MDTDQTMVAVAVLVSVFFLGIGTGFLLEGEGFFPWCGRILGKLWDLILWLPRWYFIEAFRVEVRNRRLARRIDRIERDAANKRCLERRLKNAQEKHEHLRVRMAEMPFEHPDEWLEKESEL